MEDELLQKIPPLVPQTSDVDEGDYGRALEELEYRTKLNKVEKLEHELEAERLMLDHRKCFSWVIFSLSAGWLVFIGTFLWLFSAQNAPSKHVSDSVLIALITTTTANVLGLFFIVAHWLFPDPMTSTLKNSKAKR